jgi:hypothetical protein
MNIFILDSDLMTSCRYHCDQHLNSQIKEAAQILSTVASAHLNGGAKISHLYEPTHTHHPVVKWAVKSISNCDYIRRYATTLNLERLSRFPDSTDHESVKVAYNAVAHMLHFSFSLPVEFIESKETTPFAKAMPIYIQLQANLSTVEKYRLYYRMKRLEWLCKESGPLRMTWTGVGIPEFMQSI